MKREPLSQVSATHLNSSSIKLQALEHTVLEKEQNVAKLEDYIQKLNFELAQKVDRCTYLKSLYQDKAEETEKTQKLIKSELQEVTERLDALSLFKKREQHRGKNNNLRVGTKVEQLQK